MNVDSRISFWRFGGGQKYSSPVQIYFGGMVECYKWDIAKSA